MLKRQIIRNELCVLFASISNDTNLNRKKYTQKNYLKKINVGKGSRTQNNRIRVQRTNHSATKARVVLLLSRWQIANEQGLH